MIEVRAAPLTVLQKPYSRKKPTNPQMFLEKKERAKEAYPTAVEKISHLFSP
jgi:hypothetical protein